MFFPLKNFSELEYQITKISIEKNNILTIGMSY